MTYEKNQSGAETPICIIITGEEHPTQRSVVRRTFRFTVEGRLEKTVQSEGRIDEDGKPVVGSGNPYALEICSAVVAKQAKDEPELWLDRTAKQIAKKQGTN